MDDIRNKQPDTTLVCMTYKSCKACQEECLSCGTRREEFSSRSPDQLLILTGWLVSLLWEPV